MPRISQAALTAGRTGSALSSRTTASPAASASSLSAVASPPRVGSRIQRSAVPRATSAAASSCTAAVSLSISASSCEVAARDHDGHAVIGERAGEEHPVARPDALRAEVDAVGHRPDAGRRHVEPVGLAAFDDLRVAGDDRDSGCPGGGPHRGDDAPQVGNRKALLDHESGRQPERPRADHREVVDGAVDGELADVAARELERVHDVRVGREREPARRPGPPPRRRARRARRCRAPRGRAPRRGPGSPCRRLRARA